MLYYLSEYLVEFDIPGARLMSYITFRSGVALMLSLFIATVIGRKIIDRLQLMQVGEIVRNLGLEGQMSKKGTPTMGGVIIIIAILIPCLLVGVLHNIYMILMIVATLWLGTLGFADDYIKVAHHDKDGLKGKFKIVGQVGLGLIVGLTMYLSPAIVMHENVEVENRTNHEVTVLHKSEPVKAPQTTIPFVKNNNFDYTSLTRWMGEHAATGGRLHNNVGLMNELTKIKNVMKKVVDWAPNEILLVLDGSTGQNAFEQAKQFVAATEVNALAITKLDGTAKGGVVIGISDQFNIPVKYIGLGEGMTDLQIFRKEEFVRSLFGKE